MNKTNIEWKLPISKNILEAKTFENKRIKINSLGILIFILSIIFISTYFIFIYESNESRFFRCANDKYVYTTVSEYEKFVIHIDSKCSILKSKIGSFRDEKCNLKNSLLNSNEFCNKCTKNEDVDKLRSQLKLE
jgi:hypothetical protein